jgi:membrane-anchored glycerophosphoryl diester phosphodiesterase (GDPDase)
MAKENDIKEELLKQMDKDSTGAAGVNINSAGKIIEKHKTRLRKLKWIAAIGWLITIVYAIAMHNLKVFLLDKNMEAVLTSDEFWLIRRSDTCLMVLIIIAVLLTFLLYSTSRTLTIMQISARLANIEEHLKKMSQDK